MARWALALALPPAGFVLRLGNPTELGGEAVLESLGMIGVKGREASVEAFTVIRLD